LPSLFLVMATQNPLEQEGTYPLPEAQLDRFLMHVEIDYPDAATEHKILALTRSEAINTLEKRSPMGNHAKLTQENIAQARTEILKLHVSEAAEAYIVQLIMATRQPEQYDPDLAQWIEIGASPRATIALERCARAHAWLHKRDFVSPEDIQTVLPNVLRHRLIYSYHAQAQGIMSNHVIDKILALVPVP
jgi:MoxR-like ATPase